MEKEGTKEQRDDGKLIRISKEADEAILTLLHRVNSSADQIKITKSALASFLLERFSPRFNEDDQKELYMRMVSELDLLRLAYKQAMETGAIPENLRDLLFENAGLTPSSKKIKKPRQRDGSNATDGDTEVA